MTLEYYAHTHTHTLQHTTTHNYFYECTLRTAGDIQVEVIW